MPQPDLRNRHLLSLTTQKDFRSTSDILYLSLMIPFIIAWCIYVCLTVFTSLKIRKSIILSSQQKTINIILNALIPVLWFYLIKPVIFPVDKLITREERDKMTAEENGSKLGDEIGSSRNARYL